MKKNINEPNSRPQDLQAVIDYLVDNGVSDFQVNLLIHTNMPVLGEYSNMVGAARDGRWAEVWNAAELYISGEVYN